jgi:hypothetical protein
VSQWGTVGAAEVGEEGDGAVALRAGSPAAVGRDQDDSFDLDAELERAMPRRPPPATDFAEPDGDFLTVTNERARLHSVL